MQDTTADLAASAVVAAAEAAKRAAQAGMRPELAREAAAAAWRATRAHSDSALEGIGWGEEDPFEGEMEPCAARRLRRPRTWW